MNNKTVHKVAELQTSNVISEDQALLLNEVAQKYAVAITPQMQELLYEPGIATQFVPQLSELVTTQRELLDPIGDKVNSPVHGIVHRYPDRCLLQPVTMCPVYCRFCFRRETVGQKNPALTSEQLTTCYSYIKSKPEIWEVILSGGDPLILKPQQLQQIIANIVAIEHVAVIRIHTRVPIVDSERINQAMLQALQHDKPVYIILHTNHAAEFTPQAIEAINKLYANGQVILGQTVLLKGVNADIDTLSKLMRTMIKYRVKPYYLHHPDLAPGTSHFRLSIEEGQKLVAQLRGRYSGLCQPEYVLDIPGGAGKSPIGPQYLFKQENGYKICNYNGQEFFYYE